MRSIIIISLVASAALPVAGNAAGPLPIPTGIWIDATEQCSSASGATLYDGARWGSVFYYVNPAVSREPQGEMKTILKVSKERDGFTKIPFEDDGVISGIRVKSAGPDRAILRTVSVYSKGVETWDDNLKRCDFVQLSARTQALVRRFAPSLASGPQPQPQPQPQPGRPASAAPRPPVLNPNWGVQRTASGLTYAYIARGTPAVRQLTVGCLNGGPAMIVELPGLAGRSATLTLQTSEGQATTALTRNGNSQMWIGRFNGNATPQLLTGAASVVNLTVNANGAGGISLAGSAQAVGAALSPCWKAQPAAAPAAPPSASPAPAVAAAPTGPLGIAPGYYVDAGIACPRAFDVFYYDGTRVGVTAYGANSDPTGLSLRPIGKPVRRRDGSFFIAALSMEVRKLAGGQIQLVIQDTGPPLRWCRREDVPAKFRVR